MNYEFKHLNAWATLQYKKHVLLKKIEPHILKYPTMKNLSVEIKRLVAAGETEKAIQILLREEGGLSSDWHSQAVLLSGRYEQYRKDERMGVSDEKELNKINLSLVDLANAMIQAPEVQHGRPRPMNIKGVVIGAVVLLSAMIIGFVLKNKMTQNNTAAKTTEKPSVERPGIKLVKDRLAQGDKVFNLDAVLKNWSIDMPPYGTQTDMKVVSVRRDNKDADNSYIIINLLVKNAGTGWHPVQLTPQNFVLELDETSSMTKMERSPLSIEPGERKAVELKFEAPNNTKTFKLMVRGHDGTSTSVQLRVLR
jgi:hypothetical protein